MGGFSQVLNMFITTVQAKVAKAGMKNQATTQTQTKKQDIPEVLYESEYTTNTAKRVEIGKTVKINESPKRTIVMIARNMIMLDDGTRIFKGQIYKGQTLNEITTNTACCSLNGYSYVAGDVLQTTNTQSLTIGNNAKPNS